MLIAIYTTSAKFICTFGKCKCMFALAIDVSFVSLLNVTVPLKFYKILAKLHSVIAYLLVIVIMIR